MGLSDTNRNVTNLLSARIDSVTFETTSICLTFLGGFSGIDCSCAVPAMKKAVERKNVGVSSGTSTMK